MSAELFIRMGLSIKASIIESGWIYSPLLDHFASALCASLLMNATQDQPVNAIGMIYHLEALEDITEFIQVINHAFVRQ